MAPGSAMPPLSTTGRVGRLALQAVHVVVLERRNFAVFLRRQSAEHGGAGMDDERIHPRALHRVDEGAEKLIVVALVDADAALDGDRQPRRIAHAPHALGDQLGVQHQAGAERAALDPIAGAAHVQIDSAKPAAAPMRAAAASSLGSQPPSCSAAGCSCGSCRRRRAAPAPRARAPRKRSSPCTAAHAVQTDGAGSGNGGRSNPSSGRH